MKRYFIEMGLLSNSESRVVYRWIEDNKDPVYIGNNRRIVSNFTKKDLEKNSFFREIMEEELALLL